ncbi:hypothetical protein [Clostridium manihotivorum]|uniref:Lipoprotein n=1 Tax=Clostridium manihotivorum TaxID=2320868 RepID=A0A3R5TD86_9CLOT|nr:hypothetical protein [Clostridium manihotivorum]QAA30671.1 hypothetical protein C1I91_02750 [Clostridium manihotivorum]
MNRKLVATLLVITMALFQGCSKAQDKKNVASDSTKTQEASDTSKDKDSTTNSKDEDKTDSTDQSATSDKDDSASKAKDDKSNTKTTEDSNAKETYIGTWVVKKEVGAGPVQTLSKADIKKMVGKRLSFSKNKSSCFVEKVSDLNKTINNPVYNKTSISKSKFDEGNKNKVTFEKLGVKANSLTEVNVKDSKGNHCNFYIKDKNTLILYGGGAYFELDKV